MSQTLSRELYKSSSMCMKRDRKYREGERNEIDKKGGKETKDCIPLKEEVRGQLQEGGWGRGCLHVLVRTACLEARPKCV